MTVTSTCVVLLLVSCAIVQAQFEKYRCHCICDTSKWSKHLNSTTRGVYNDNRDPSECKCEYVVLHQVPELNSVHFAEFCARCECKYQVRNILVIKIGVFLCMALIAYLTLHLILHLGMKLIRLREVSRSTKYRRQFNVNCDDTMDHTSSGPRINLVAVYSVVTIITVLVIYMLCLVCLNPLLRRRKGTSRYQQHYNEEDDNIFVERTLNNEIPMDSSPAGRLSHDSEMRSRTTTSSTGDASQGGFLSRMSSQRDKWMDKVQEQRRTIFKEHSILN